MEPHLSATQIAEYIGGECDLQLYNAVVEHLKACSACGELVDKRLAELRKPAEEAEILLQLEELGISFSRKSS